MARPLSENQKYILCMANPEWITGSPSDGRSLRVLQSLQKRGLVTFSNNAWKTTTEGADMARELRAAGDA